MNEKINKVVMSKNGRIVFKTAGITNKTYEFGSNFVRSLYIIKVTESNNIKTLEVLKI